MAKVLAPLAISLCLVCKGSSCDGDSQKHEIWLVFFNIKKCYVIKKKQTQNQDAEGSGSVTEPSCDV